MSQHRLSAVHVFLMFIGGTLLAGCVRIPYRRVEITDSDKTLRLRTDEDQVVRGPPMARHRSAMYPATG